MKQSSIFEYQSYSTSKKVCIKQETLSVYKDDVIIPIDLAVDAFTQIPTAPTIPSSNEYSPQQDVDNTLVLLFDLDSDLILTDSEDMDYEYKLLNDIDLNYQSQDEPDYGFRVIGDAPKRDKGNNKISIDAINIELMASGQDCCPICKVYLGELLEQFIKAHVQGCLIEANFTVSSVKIKEKEPVLMKMPLYKNKDPLLPTPLKKIDPPKTLNFKSNRKPIPNLKILDFPKNPVERYKVSMDAFNYCPHHQINKYFLSHFHQDHYGGISKKWCYERLFDCIEDFDDLQKYKPIIYATEITAKLLTLKIGIDPRFIMPLHMETRYLVMSYMEPRDTVVESDSNEPGLYVTLISANHCPGSAIFLFESLGFDTDNVTYLHCGDFRVDKAMLQHRLLSKYLIKRGTSKLDKVYLDTTYLTFHYNFPKQEDVCREAACMFQQLCDPVDCSLLNRWFGTNKQSRITDFIKINTKSKKKFLIAIGTYVIGKERLAIAILKALNKCPIFILSIKSRDYQYNVVKSFGDEYLDSVLTDNEYGSDDNQCIIHLVPMDIIYTIDEFRNYVKYNKYFDHFEKCLALRPTGWSYSEEYLRDKDVEALEYSAPTPATRNQFLNKICDVCLSCPEFTFSDDILPQHKKLKGGNHERENLRIYSLPYSEHSSYRELAYFCILLRIGEIIPTVNTDQESWAVKMKHHIKYWKELKALTPKNKDPDVDPMIYAKLKHLNIDKF